MTAEISSEILTDTRCCKNASAAAQVAAYEIAVICRQGSCCRRGRTAYSSRLPCIRARNPRRHADDSESYSSRVSLKINPRSGRGKSRMPPPPVSPRRLQNPSALRKLQLSGLASGYDGRSDCQRPGVTLRNAEWTIVRWSLHREIFWRSTVSVACRSVPCASADLDRRQIFASLQHPLSL